MSRLKDKCRADEYDIEIDSELTYEEGYGLIEIILGCINIDLVKPLGQLSILFKDWDYYFPITKEDNLRIRKLLEKLGYDRQIVEDLHGYSNWY